MDQEQIQNQQTQQLTISELYQGLDSFQKNLDTDNIKQQQEKIKILKKKSQHVQKTRKYREKINKKLQDLENKSQYYYEKIKSIQQELVDQQTQQLIQDTLLLQEEYFQLVNQKQYKNAKRVYNRKDNMSEQQKKQILQKQKSEAHTRSAQKKKEKIQILDKISQNIDKLGIQIPNLFQIKNDQDSSDINSNNNSQEQQMQYQQNENISENPSSTLHTSNNDNNFDMVMEDEKIFDNNENQNEQIEFDNFNIDEIHNDNSQDFYNTNSYENISENHNIFKEQSTEDNQSNIKLNTLNKTVTQDYKDTIIPISDGKNKKSIIYTGILLFVCILALVSSNIDGVEISNYAVQVKEFLQNLRNYSSRYCIFKMKEQFFEQKLNIQNEIQSLQCEHKLQNQYLKKEDQCTFNNLNEELIDFTLNHMLELMEKEYLQFTYVPEFKDRELAFQAFVNIDWMNAIIYYYTGQYEQGFQALDKIYNQVPNIQESYEFMALYNLFKSFIVCKKTDKSCIYQYEKNIQENMFFIDQNVTNNFGTQISYYSISAFYYFFEFNLDVASEYINKAYYFLKSVQDTYIYSFTVKLKVEIDIKNGVSYQELLEVLEEAYQIEAYSENNEQISLHQTITISQHKKVMYQLIKQQNIEEQIEPGLLEELKKFDQYNGIRKAIDNPNYRNTYNYNITSVRNDINLIKNEL